MAPTRMDQAKINSCVDVLCHKGCREVNRAIAVLELNEPLPETDGLNTVECEEVLRELKAIMAVYDRPCDA